MFKLGFTDEDVTGGWQHWRLATECGSAFESEGLPASFGVLEAAGEGRYLVEWFIKPEAALVLDKHQVAWRRFLIGQAETAPRGAYPPMMPATSEQRQILEERKRAAFK
jgi:hypothetical protein